jgi:protein translocase SecG subunit
MDENTLAWIQIVLSVLLIVAVILQPRGSGAGSLFGGPSSIGGGEYYRSRRGFEKFLMYFTIILGSFLVITSFAYLYI